MSLFPGPQESTFWYDFESLTDNNLWKDQGPHSLHATPQAGFSSPAYGLSRTIRGKGYANFTGAANVYATLPLRYYTVAPTQPYTFVCVYEPTSKVTVVAFSALSVLGGSFYGIQLYCDSAHAAGNRLVHHPMTGTAVLQAIYTDTVASVTQTWVVTNAQAQSAWESRVGKVTARAGAYAPLVHDAAASVCIGSNSAGGELLRSRLYFLALFPFVFTDAEAKAMSDWLRNQV